MIIRNPEDIGILLKNLRKKYRISQTILAKWAWVSLYSIMRYEKRNYVQASSEIVFSILAYFIREHVKDTLHLSIISPNDTMNTDNTFSSDIR